MQGIIAGWVVSFLVGELSQKAAGTNWTVVKSDVHAKIAQFVHSAWLDAELDKLADTVVDAIAKACQNTSGLETILGSLANSDMGAATAAVKALVVSVAPELAPLLG